MIDATAIAARHAPSTTITRVEPMSPAFTKHHLSDGSVLHHFTGEEPHADPHDHPFAIDSEVLTGGYVEEVFTVIDKRWKSRLEHRRPGETHRVWPTHIHRLVRLPHGECWTRCWYGAPVRETRFWRARGGVVESRNWRPGSEWERAA